MKADPQVTALNAYLSKLPLKARATLETLRNAIRAAAPEATEGVSYGMPAFRHHGPLVAYAAFKDHCSFFPMNSTLIDGLGAELRGYSTSKGTIRFEIGDSLPAALVRKIVKARIAENENRAAQRSTRQASAGLSERKLPPASNGTKRTAAKDTP